MSTIQGSQAVWSVNENAKSKYEKCLNITEEIYKRIDITFQIKKLETGAQSNVSDPSDQIDSNELSNETDLFACDKSSISSSTEAEKPPPTKFVNINNNEEKPRPAVVYKRPRKRFRKRVKKRQAKPVSDSDGSSDEALPLARIIDVDVDKCDSELSPDNVMGVPHIVIVAKDPKQKTQQSEKKPLKKDTDKTKEPLETVDKIEKESKTIEKAEKETDSPTKEGKEIDNRKHCNMCSLSFRGDRGLRRHMTMSHIVCETKNQASDKNTKPA